MTVNWNWNWISALECSKTLNLSALNLTVPTRRKIPLPGSVAPYSLSIDYTLCAVFIAPSPPLAACFHACRYSLSTHYSLRKRAKYQQFQCKTKRFQNSALPYLIRLLNEKDLNPWVYFHVIFVCYTHNIINVFNCSWKLWLVLCFTNGVCCNDQLIINEPLS